MTEEVIVEELIVQLGNAQISVGPPTVSIPVGGQVTISGTCIGCGQVRLYRLDGNNPGPETAPMSAQGPFNGQYRFNNVPVISGTAYGIMIVGINPTNSLWAMTVTNWTAP